MSAAESILARALPTLTPANLATGGRLKETPEDFVVEEIPAYVPCGSGEHLFLWVQKRDVSPDFLLGHLSRALGVRREDIGLAGLKDRRAVTRQWISVPGGAEDRVAAINSDAIQVLEQARHGNKLKTGHLRGNRFDLLIREPAPGAFTQAEEIAKRIKTLGVPNYYGEQRFGIDGETLDLGLALLRGAADARQIPAQRRKFLTRLALSATQSALFNDVLAQRLEQGVLHQVQAGDVMQVAASGGLFIVEDVAREQERFEGRETVITGPLFGPKMKSPSGPPREWEQGALQRMGLSEQVFRTFKKLTPGARRGLLIWPEGLSVAAEAAGLRLTFTLPSGSYATVVLREFLKGA